MKIGIAYDGVIHHQMKNGDGAQWIQKKPDCECICVLGEYRRNKKITECVSDKKAAQVLRELLLSGKYQLLPDAIEAYLNSVDDEKQAEKFKEALIKAQPSFRASETMAAP